MKNLKNLKNYIIGILMLTTLVGVTYASLSSYDEVEAITKRNTEQMTQFNKGAEMLRAENRELQEQIDGLQLKLDKNNQAIEKFQSDWTDLDNLNRLLMTE